MDKELSKLTNPDNFNLYLKEKLDGSVYHFISLISKYTEVIIFSGIIRNYFLNYRGELRDFDFVVPKVDDEVFDIISKYKFRRNSFGGFKIEVENLEIDLWELENTWAIKNNKINISELFIENSLPKTSFFNFSAAIYKFRSKEFIFEEEFKKFIDTRELDLVLEDNPYPHLCLINTVYYQRKFNLTLSNNLKQYYLGNFNNYTPKEYDNMQLKHFGKVKYPYKLLKFYFSSFEREFQNSNKESQNLVH